VWKVRPVQPARQGQLDRKEQHTDNRKARVRKGHSRKDRNHGNHANSCFHDRNRRHGQNRSYRN
jgi:hypothetical protein